MNTQPKARNEESPAYGPLASQTVAEDELIARALAALSARVVGRDALASPTDVKNYLRLRLAPLPHEVFAVVFLDAQHRVIECREMFRGTLTQTSVYPREVAKEALALNAGAVILAHNHPSGVAEPSRADEFLTMTLKSALALIDVRVLDHVVVSQSGSMSFSERGLL